MVQNNFEMADPSLGILIFVSSVASLLCLITLVSVCLWCFKKSDSDEDSEDGDRKAYDNTEQVGYRSTETTRDDVKELKKHPWEERIHSGGLLGSRNVQILKSAVMAFRYEKPSEKEFVTETVQPNRYSQTSLNSSLGVRAVQPNAGSKPDGGSRSASSSPFHRSSNGDAASATDAMDASADMDEYCSLSEKLGKIQFSISYDFQEMTLTLRVMRAVSLPAKDFSGTSDPYVKIMLLPDKKTKLQTNIKRRNLNPRWNELFAFEGYPHSKLMNRTLYLQVLDYDRFSRDDPIGEVCLPLSDLDLSTGQTMWKALQPCAGHLGKLGEVLLSLCYQPTVGRITLVVLKARDLKSKDINGFSDPYVKIWQMHEGKKLEKKKTTTKDRNLNPVFNESFVFSVPYEKIRQTSLIISVMDYDRLGRNEMIGQVVLGTKSGPMEVKHWNEMFAKSRQPVAQWHLLKDFG